MTPAARLSAAIEILDDISARHKPIASALKDWGKAHRFAGSGDRTVIGNLVFDVVRRKGSLAWLMQNENGRALVLSLFAKFWSTAENLKQMCTGDAHSPSPLSDEEWQRLNAGFSAAPDHIQAFQQQWIFDALGKIYSRSDNIALGQALAERAPIDIRVNALRSTRDKLVPKLERFKAVTCPVAPDGLRIPYGATDQRSPSVETDDAYLRGLFELQDEGSQIVCKLIDAWRTDQVLDYCAGAGGKTLGLSVQMDNKGQIIATDNDPHRLAKIYERLKRAQARNVQVKRIDEVEKEAMRFDKVVLDVPCTGTGAWRRRPDNKWKLNTETLANRVQEQTMILEKGAAFVKAGGQLAYITCSLLPEENEQRVAAFLKSETGHNFDEIDMAERWSQLFTAPLPHQPVEGGVGLCLSPSTSKTDGFYIACLKRKA